MYFVDARSDYDVAIHIDDNLSTNSKRACVCVCMCSELKEMGKDRIKLKSQVDGIYTFLACVCVCVCIQLLT